MALRIGELSFISGLPVGHPIAAGWLGSQSTHHQGKTPAIRRGLPGELDAAMAAGELDAGPISTLEYLRHPGRYALVPGMSISSWGRIGSAMLVSHVSLPQLAGETIVLPPHGATSNMMVRWMLSKMYGIEARYVERAGTVDELLTHCTATLVIGDAAVIEAQREREGHHLDLGAAWWQVMQVPFVTTVWACRADLAQADRDYAVNLFTRAKECGRARWTEVLDEASQRLSLEVPEIEAYFALLNYDFTPVHQQSMDMLATDFRELAAQA